MSKPNNKVEHPINRTSVRQALRTWHSLPKLGQHPLAKLKIVERRREAANYPNTLEDRGRAVRDVLRDAIDTLPHNADASGNGEAEIEYLDKKWRPHVILNGQYIKGRSPDYMAVQLGIAPRTYFDEQKQALRTLVDILRQREEVLVKGTGSSSVSEAGKRFETLPLNRLPDPGPLPSGSLMPLSRNPMFVGRESDLRTLAKALKGGETVAIGQIETAATTGLGGIGKTQLASEFVHRYGQYFDGGVFWLSFADAKAIPTEVAACGGVGAMDLRPDFGELTLEDQLRLVRSAWQAPIPRLLVFDNCEEPELMAQWRPPSGGCRILVTSRRADWDPTLNIQALPLDVLARRESLALLREHCPEAENNILEAIAEELGDLPLALHLAGSYMARYRRVLTPAQYLDQLQDPALLDHPSMKGTGTSPTGHVQNVYRTIALSYNKLEPTVPVDK